MTHSLKPEPSDAETFAFGIRQLEEAEDADLLARGRALLDAHRQQAPHRLDAKFVSIAIKPDDPSAYPELIALDEDGNLWVKGYVHDYTGFEPLTVERRL